MPLDRAGAEKELGANLRIRQTVLRQAGDVQLLGRQLVASLRRAFADLLSGREQLGACALGKRLHSDVDEQLVRSAQLLASVHAAILPPQPFAVEKPRATLVGPQ